MKSDGTLEHVCEQRRYIPYVSTVPCHLIAYSMLDVPGARNLSGLTLHGLWWDWVQTCIPSMPECVGAPMARDTRFLWEREFALDAERRQRLSKNTNHQGTLLYLFLLLSFLRGTNHLCGKWWHRKIGKDRTTCSFSPMITHIWPNQYGVGSPAWQRPLPEY